MPPLALSALVGLSVAVPAPPPSGDELKQLSGSWVLTQLTWRGDTVD
jgi:hypothetical protein